MILLASLGMFAFTMTTIPYQGWSRSKTWRHPHQNVVGMSAPPASQYTGAEPEEISISGELRPEVTGGSYGIEVLREMADSGEPQPFMLGTGEVLGSYVILSIGEKFSELNQDGSARAIAFDMTLKKVADTALGLQDKSLLLAAGMVRRIVGV